MSGSSWTITATEVANEPVTLVIDAPNSNYAYLDTVAYTVGEPGIPQAIQDYIDSFPFEPTYLMVVNIEPVSSGGQSTINIGTSESVLECVNPSGTKNAAYLVFDSTSSEVKKGKKGKGKDKLR